MAKKNPRKKTSKKRAPRIKDMALRKVLSGNLRALMAKKGHGVLSLSVKAKVAASQTHEVLNDKKAPTIDWLARVARALGVTPWETLKPGAFKLNAKEAKAAAAKSSKPKAKKPAKKKPAKVAKKVAKKAAKKTPAKPKAETKKPAAPAEKSSKPKATKKPRPKKAKSASAAIAALTDTPVNGEIVDEDPLGIDSDDGDDMDDDDSDGDSFGFGEDEDAA